MCLTFQEQIVAVMQKAAEEIGAKLVEVQRKGFDFKFDINPPRPSVEKETPDQGDGGLAKE